MEDRTSNRRTRLDGNSFISTIRENPIVSGVVAAVTAVGVFAVTRYHVASTSQYVAKTGIAN